MKENVKHLKKFRQGTEWATFKLPKPFYLCFQRNAPVQFEECHIPGQNNFLNPHFYSVQFPRAGLVTLNHLPPQFSSSIHRLVGWPTVFGGEVWAQGEGRLRPPLYGLIGWPTVSDGEGWALEGWGRRGLGLGGRWQSKKIQLCHQVPQWRDFFQTQKLKDFIPSFFLPSRTKTSARGKVMRPLVYLMTMPSYAIGLAKVSVLEAYAWYMLPQAQCTLIIFTVFAVYANNLLPHAQYTLTICYRMCSVH